MLGLLCGHREEVLTFSTKMPPGKALQLVGRKPLRLGGARLCRGVGHAHLRPLLLLQNKHGKVAQNPTEIKAETVSLLERKREEAHAGNSFCAKEAFHRFKTQSYHFCFLSNLPGDTGTTTSAHPWHLQSGSPLSTIPGSQEKSAPGPGQEQRG